MAKRPQTKLKQAKDHWLFSMQGKECASLGGDINESFAEMGLVTRLELAFAAGWYAYAAQSADAERKPVGAAKGEGE